MKAIFAICVVISNIGLLVYSYGWWAARPVVAIVGLVSQFAVFFFMVAVQQRITVKTGIRSPLLLRLDDASTQRFARRVVVLFALSVLIGGIASQGAGMLAGHFGVVGMVLASLLLLVAFGVNISFQYRLERVLDWEAVMDDGSTMIERQTSAFASYNIVEPVFVSIGEYRAAMARAEAYYQAHNAGLYARYPHKNIVVGENGVLGVAETRAEAGRMINAMIRTQRRAHPNGHDQLPCIVRNPSATRLNTRHPSAGACGS